MLMLVLNEFLKLKIVLQSLRVPCARDCLFRTICFFIQTFEIPHSEIHSTSLKLSK